jgi:hypothetical protein
VHFSPLIEVTDVEPVWGGIRQVGELNMNLGVISGRSA